MSSKRNIRISATQKDILFVLYAIEQKGLKAPISSMKIFNMINSSRSNKIFDTNFRTSCHTLASNEFIYKLRDGSLKLAYKLTLKGRQTAESIFKERVGQ